MDATNPFTKNSQLLETGFYFNSETSKIVYVFKEGSYDDSFLRTYSNDQRNSVNTEKLIALWKLEDQLGNLHSDFKWICESESVREAFTNYLLAYELYLLLEQFKGFCTECDNFVSPFKVGDVVEAIDDYYQVTRKELDFLGQVVEVKANGAVQVKVLKHKLDKYVGKLVPISEINHIKKLN
jgi:hypothetical protein